MYGLVLEGVYFYIQYIFGDEILDQVISKANIEMHTFVSDQVRTLNSAIISYFVAILYFHTSM